MAGVRADQPLTDPLALADKLLGIEHVQADESAPELAVQPDPDGQTIFEEMGGTIIDPVAEIVFVNDYEPAALPEPDDRPAALPVPVGAPVPEARAPVAPVPASDWECVDGHPNAAQAKFCMECGTPREQQRKCPSGHINPVTAKFCGECGQPAVGMSLTTMAMAASITGHPEADLRPRPVSELTPAELAERERQHAEAMKEGRTLPPLKYELARSDQRVKIHILVDGWTFAGQVWYRGQELEFDVGSPRWVQAQAWINMDSWAQMEQYGKVMFGLGPWPGKKYTDGFGGYETRGPLSREEGAAKVSGPSLEELERAEAAERRRRGAVPAPSLR